MTFEKDDTCNQTVGMMHFFDGFRPFLLGKLGVAPIFEKAVVNPILVDCTEFEEQCLVKPLDDFFVAFQCPLSCFLHGIL